jgi:hypothetical protein
MNITPSFRNAHFRNKLYKRIVSSELLRLYTLAEIGQRIDQELRRLDGLGEIMVAERTPKSEEVPG